VSPAETSDRLHTRVRTFVEGSLAEPARREPFDELALALARFQAEHVAPFARLVRARGVDLDHARSADAIPAVPTDVFRLARVAAHHPEQDVALFRTSGTTQADRGEHAFRTTSTYALVALCWARRLLWRDEAELAAIVLAPPYEEQPSSSLGFMLDLFARELAGPATFHVRLGDRGDAVLDGASVERAAAAARAAGRPAIVLATSFALVHLLDASAGLGLRLPEGSRVMQTGGFKGRSREVPADALRAAVARLFDVPEARVVGEYGMTELSSQLYEGTLAASIAGTAPPPHGTYFAPPWVRVNAVDPVSLAILPPGEVGVARIVDLANVDSAVAIQTADRVRVADGAVTLLGRLPGAVPRGCSIAIDEMLGGT
jgi:hypothetical protein